MVAHASTIWHSLIDRIKLLILVYRTFAAERPLFKSGMLK